MTHGPADATGAAGPFDPHDLPEEDLTLTMPRVTPGEPQGVPGRARAPLAEDDWAEDDLAAVAGGRGRQFASGLAAGLTTVPDLRAAIRRRWRLWIATALVGLVVGIGLITVRPPAGKAQTQILLAQPPDVNSQDAVLTDVTLMQSRALAELAMRRLHLSENVYKFMSSFTVVSLTDQVLEIIVSAPTSSEAVQRANGITAAYLHYRASIVQLQRQATMVKLNAQLTQARLQLGTIAGQLYSVSRRAVSASRAARLAELDSEQTAATSSLVQLESATSSYEVSSDAANDQEISGSHELYPAAALPPSKYGKPAVYAVGGLVAGLLLGMAWAAAGALMSDRLRRRDDVAFAVGAPVRLSVGPLRLGRPGRRGLSLARALQAVGAIEVQRIAAQIRAAVPEQAGGAGAVAVIAMDNPYAAVLPVLALALSCARAGGQVIVADLTAGAALGRLLGLADPGVRMVTVAGEQIAVAVPDSGDLTPLGPLPQPEGSFGAQGTGAAGLAGRSEVSGRRRSGRSPAGQVSAVQSTAGYQLAAAYESADLLLTVATLDPALGAEHLPTWAADAVVIVTAGQSSATKIHSVSEMTWLAGTDIRCAILIGADKNDESIGTGPAAEDTDLDAVQEDIAPTSADAALNASRSDDRRG